MANSYTPKLTSDWDLQLGADGNFLMVRGVEGIAQNIANACMNFRGGLFYFRDSGIAWFTDALGQKFQRALIASRMREAAEQVEGVASVDSVTIEEMDTKTRTVKGLILFTTDQGENGKAYIH